MGVPAEKLARVHGQMDILTLQQIKDRDIANILYDAAEEAEELITRNLEGLTSIGATVRRAQLSQAIQGLGNLAGELWDNVGEETRKGIYASSYLAADQAIDLDLLHGMPVGAITQYAPNMHFYAAQSAQSLISRNENGIRLADNIYAHGRETVREVGAIVDKSLALQQSAKEIAKKVRGHYRPDVPGGSSYAAMRLGRTEINNAHHRTTIRMAEQRPWVEGFKWNLSGSHPKPDECNDYAERDFGMGPGIWAKESVPGKPHPNCLCYLTTQMPEPDEFTDQLINGDYDNWLNREGVRCGG